MKTFNEYQFDEAVYGSGKINLDVDEEFQFISTKFTNWLDSTIKSKQYNTAMRDFLNTWGRDRKHKLFGGDRRALAADIARKYSGVHPRALIQHLNKAVKKGVLPKHLELKGHA